jgi:polysaccharide biosynthesis/export protein
MYFSRAATVLASVPAFLFLASHSPADYFFASDALANGLPTLAPSAPSLSPEPPNQPSGQPSAQALPGLPRLGNPSAPSGSPSAPSPAFNLQRLPLSPGDRIRIQIPGLGGEEFSGEYEVNFNGDLEIPYIGALPVTGLVTTEVESRLRDALLAQQFFRPGQLRVSAQVLNYSPIQVAVTGEVFEPGRILLSSGPSARGMSSSPTTASAEETAASTEEVVELPGDYPVERYLTSALKAIGGVKPTADVSKVQVLRGTESVIVDLSGVFSGNSVSDFPLIAGDQIIIPNSGEFQSALVRPSQITPDSIDTYVSNVTVPGGTGALAGTSNINVASFEYGINLAQALVSARCVGGTESTNANRRALLIQTDTVTGGLTTAEYSISDLVSSSTESSADNPFLMPDDAIACYDSRNTNVRGVLGTVVDFLNPLNLLIDLFD